MKVRNVISGICFVLFLLSASAMDSESILIPSIVAISSLLGILAVAKWEEAHGEEDYRL